MKMEKSKKVLSLLLAITMCFSLVIVAQAETGQDKGPVNAGVYYIVSNDGSGKEIVIDEGGAGGTKVALDSICWTRQSNADHHWRIEPTGNSDGSYYLRNIKSDLVLTPRREKDVVVDGAFYDESYPAGSQPENILEQQVKRDNDPIQQWIFEPVEGQNNKYRIKNVKSGGYIEIASYTLNGWRVGTLQAPLDESKNSQIWTLEELPGDFYVYTDINHGSISPQSPRVSSGASQTFSIKAEIGHHIESILVDGEAIVFEENASSHSLTVENVTKDTYVEVVTAKNDNVIYVPGNNFPGRNKSLSPRLAEASDGTLYATFEWGERSDDSREYCFPIFESTDKGITWNKVGEVTNDDAIRPDVLIDKSTGEIVEAPNANTVKCNWQLQNCPQLYILPEALGTLEAGTMICAGNNVLLDEYAPKVSDGGDGGLYKTQLDLYYSTDSGRTWDYLSNIDYGGVNRMGYDPVWEPFFLFYEGQLVCYYSDEKVYDYTNNQQLVHKTTTDGLTWSDAVIDVKMNWNNGRPGMPIVSQLANGKWIYTYEGVGTSTVTGLDSYYKISDTPLDWGENKGDRGNYLWRGGSPYVFTLKDGRVVANTHSVGGLLFNTNNDASGEWIEVPLGISGAYNRQTYQLSANGSDEIIIIHSSHSDGTYIKVSLFDPKEIGIDDTILSQQYITSKESSEVIGIWQGSKSNGALCVTWENTKASDQKWLPVDQGDGTYAFTNVNSGLALTAKTDGSIEQRTLETEENETKQAQSWILEPSEDDSWTFKNVLTEKYMSYQKDTSQAAEVDRYKLIMVDEVINDAQRWGFNKVYTDGNTFDPSVPEAVLTGISLDTENIKTEYIYDSELELANLTVTASYSDDSTAPVSIEDCTVTGFDGKTIGTQTITVEYTEGEVTVSATFDITVIKADQEAPKGLSTTPDYDNASNGTITGVSDSMEYRITGTEEWTAITTATVTGLTAGTYEVRYAETDTLNASPSTTVTVLSETTPKGDQEAPKGLSTTPDYDNASNGTITGVSDSMEYRITGTEEWTAITAATLTGLTAGTYEVRYAETDTLNASPATTVTVLSETTSTDKYLIGDVYIDGLVNLKDVLAIQKHVAEKDSFAEDVAKMFVANVDQSKTADNENEVTIADALLLQKWVAKLFTSDYINTEQPLK